MYPKGSSVEVFYSPKEPHLAVLQPGTSLSSYGWHVSGWTLFGIGLLIVAKFAVGLVLVVVFVLKKGRKS